MQFAKTVFIMYLSYLSPLTLASTVQQPWETPLSELLSVRDSLCCEMEMKKINESIREWTNCINSFIFELPSEDELEEFEELRQQYSTFCRNPFAFKNCWKDITDRLNTCEPTRGDVAITVYFAIYDHTCKNFGENTIESAIKAAKEGELCDLDYSSQICKDSMKDWQTLEVCRRYDSQRMCEESAIEECKNEEHKKVLRKNLELTGRALGCDDKNVDIEPLSSSSYRITIAKIWTPLIVLLLKLT